mmetsp:Transcript_69884/g.138309  ORF Transcript_69884/g.138309 Transcript_69884/m.138309 type:complete len:120 (+) Transcript_69884:83-442(+)|eukprot:CAMPEP_0172868684 /NCGR_PEP_ID=MMETSP1075-20121228/86965_1 /TAXON_ID=2916 /ORGANISM="Ceratium fusus, Strain PA161109" /LENGTH=119 /DNA_ID=CAMNT_0013718377 /DNA_START=83 /DNA_END=442 /DNA_ORIENTATION=+
MAHASVAMLTFCILASGSNFSLPALAFTDLRGAVGADHVAITTTGRSSMKADALPKRVRHVGDTVVADWMREYGQHGWPTNKPSEDPAPSNDPLYAAIAGSLIMIAFLSVSKHYGFARL